MVSLSSPDCQFELVVMDDSGQPLARKAPSTASSLVSDDDDPHYDPYQFALIDFVVEGKNFRVPSTQFVQSNCLKTMPCTVRYSAATNREIIELPGVTRKDFKALLKALYPLPYFDSKNEMPEDEWAAVLELSSRWGIIELRKAAISALLSQNVSALSRVRYGCMHHAPSLLSAGSIELVERGEAISVTEAESVGISHILPILAARDLALRPYRVAYQSRVATVTTFTSGGWGASALPTKAALVLKSITTEFNDVLLATEPIQDDVQLLTLARRSGVEAWIKEAYQKLIEREHCLTLIEAEMLDMRDIVGIFRARESYMTAMKNGLLSGGHTVSIIVDSTKLLEQASDAIQNVQKEDPANDASPVNDNMKKGKKKVGKKSKPIKSSPFGAQGPTDWFANVKPPATDDPCAQSKGENNSLTLG